MTRSHLVPKQIVDKNGKVTTVYVNPSQERTEGDVLPSLTAPPSTSMRDKVSSHMNDLISPQDLGLEDIYPVSHVSVSEQDEDGMCYADVVVELDNDFWAKSYDAEVAKKGGDRSDANYFVSRALGETFEQILRSRYGEFDMDDSMGDEGIRLSFGIPLDPEKTSLGDLSNRIWDETPVVQMANEFDPGTWGALDMSRAVHELVDIESGGEYRDLYGYDLLVNLPTEEDIREVAEENPSIAGNVMSSDLGWNEARKRAKERSFQRAFEKNIDIPKDYEDAFELEWEQREPLVHTEHEEAYNELAKLRRTGVSRAEILNSPELARVNEIAQEIRERGRGNPKIVRRVLERVETERQNRKKSVFESFKKDSE